MLTSISYNFSPKIFRCSQIYHSSFKLCGKQYNRNFVLQLTVASQLRSSCNITTQPKQGRQAAPMNSMYFLMSMKRFTVFYCNLL
jgi:hypothetical protein